MLEALKEILSPTRNAIEIGINKYNFTPETQQFFSDSYSSKYPKDKSIVIIGEPHDSSAGQFNLFKGLESFFASNPELIKQTIFLSEGTEANKPISVRSLISEEPRPTDNMIRKVLKSFLITGYMAYEWKHQLGIPIIGTENQGLYELSRRFASLCRENPNAIFDQREYIDGSKLDIPLAYAWAFAIAARNKQIARTLIEQIGKYHNPMLFVAFDHVRDKRAGFEKKWDEIIKRHLIDAQYMGPLGALVFPWAAEGENWFLYQNVKKDDEMFDIEHYLREVKIGYTFLEPKGGQTPEDIRRYNKVFFDQRKK